MSRKNPKKYTRKKTKSIQDLEPRQELFCHEYLKDRNATQAAIRAGYSAKTAFVTGPRLVSHPCVEYKINRLIEKQLNELDIEANFVAKEILKLATVDISDIFDTNGNIKDVKDMPENVRKSIASIEVLEEFDRPGKDRKRIGFVKKIKFWPKDKSLELLGKYLKMFGDVNILPGGTLVFADIKIEQKDAPTLLTDINNRLAQQFAKQ